MDKLSKNSVECAQKIQSKCSEVVLVDVFVFTVNVPQLYKEKEFNMGPVSMPKAVAVAAFVAPFAFVAGGVAGFFTLVASSGDNPNVAWNKSKKVAIIVTSAVEITGTVLILASEKAATYVREKWHGKKE